MSARTWIVKCLAVNLYFLMQSPIFALGTDGFQPIFFGNPAPPPSTTAAPNEEELPIDSDFTSRVNSLSSIDDFADYFDFKLPLFPLEIHTRIELSTSSGDALDLPQANCIPEKTAVPLDLPTEGGLTFFPSCVRVERCGGCCLLSHHSCQPTSVENILVKTVKVEDNVIKRRRRVRDVEPSFLSVKVEKHLACECRCKLQPSECNPALHHYNEHYCTCDCNDRDKEIACALSKNHYWDSDICECFCRNTQSCSSGKLFDHKTCSCR